MQFLIKIAIFYSSLVFIQLNLHVYMSAMRLAIKRVVDSKTSFVTVLVCIIKSSANIHHYCFFNVEVGFLTFFQHDDPALVSLHLETLSLHHETFSSKMQEVLLWWDLCLLKMLIYYGWGLFISPWIRGFRKVKPPL